MELIERELYMRRIRPFIGERGAVKVFTGIRRCGKSAMMELVKRELRRRGIAEDRMVSLNFESRAEEAVRNADAAESSRVLRLDRIPPRVQKPSLPERKPNRFP